MNPALSSGAVKNQTFLWFLIQSEAFLHCFGIVKGCEVDASLPHHPFHLQDSMEYNCTKNPASSQSLLHIIAATEPTLPLKCVNFSLKWNFSKNSKEKTALMCLEWNSSFKKLWDLEDIYSFNPLYQNHWQNHNETFCSFLKTKTKEEKKKSFTEN